MFYDSSFNKTLNQASNCQGIQLGIEMQSFFKYELFEFVFYNEVEQSQQITSIFFSQSRLLSEI